MSDYLDRLDSYYEEGESYWDREARLNKFKEGSKKVKGNIYRYRYLENIGEIQITSISVRNDEYYIWMNSKCDKLYLLGTHSNVKPEVVTIKMGDIRYYRHNIIK